MLESILPSLAADIAVEAEQALALTEQIDDLDRA